MRVNIVLDFDGVIFKRSKHLRKYLPQYLKLFLKTLEKSIREERIYGLSLRNLIKHFLRLENFNPDLECLDIGFFPLLYLSHLYDFNIYIVSSSKEDEVRKYVDDILKYMNRRGITPKVEIFASRGYDVSSLKKAEALSKIRKNGEITIFVGDSELDSYASKNTDIPFVVRTFLYYLSPKKPVGNSISSLEELVDFLYKLKF